MTKEEIEKIFLYELEELNIRAKNILGFLKLYDFDNFYDYYIIQQKKIPFNKARNCGEKTENDLNRFVETILKQAQNLSNEKAISKLPYTQPVETLKINTQIELNF